MTGLSYFMALVLRPFTPDDRATCLVAHEELAAEGFDFLWGYEPTTDWDDYLKTVADYAAGRHIPEDRVASALLVADVDDDVVGRISVRFALNDFLFARWTRRLRGATEVSPPRLRHPDTHARSRHYPRTRR